MPNFLHPGVYVLETPSPARSIEAAATSTAIFVGMTERGPATPTKIFSRGDFARMFGGYKQANTGSGGPLPTLAYAMDAFFGNGGTTAYILRAMVGNPLPPSTPAATAARSGGTGAVGSPFYKLLAASPGAWANAGTGSGLYAIFSPASDNAPSRARLTIVYTSPDTGVQQIVEDFDHLSLDSHDENYMPDVLNRSLYVKWDSSLTPAFPNPLDNTDYAASNATLLGLATGGVGFTGGSGGNADVAVGDYNFTLLDDITDASLMVCPSVSDDSKVIAITNAAIGYTMARAHQDLFFIGALPRHKDQALAAGAVTGIIGDFTNLVTTKSNFAALYWPWCKVTDPVGIGKDPTTWISPGGAVAGVYARTDAQRGVWKAPAGLDAALLGVRDLEFKVQDGHQDSLNPLGINALRNQPAGGLVVWGARTMQPASEWRYVPVRRMAIFLRVSIYNGIQFAVFEPNDEPLWAALRLTIGGVMDRLFRQGAFAGNTPKDAYFVKCDGETTTGSDQLAGFVNVLVGFSPLRPAEFVVVKLSQIVSQKA